MRQRRSPDGSPFIYCRLRWNDRRADAGGIGRSPLLDTGAQKSILSPGFARAAGIGKPDTAATGGITGIDGRETALVAHKVAAVVGSWSYRNIGVSVAALPLFDRLGGMNEPIAVIGMDWIGSRQFAIDYGAERVWQRTSARKARR